MDSFERLWRWCREPKKPTPSVGILDERLRVGYTPLFFIRVFAFALGWFLITSYFVYQVSWEHSAYTLAWREALSFGWSPSLHNSSVALVGGVLMGLVLGWVLPRTRLRWDECVIVSYLPLFVIQIVNNVLEGIYFSDLRGFPPYFFSGMTIAVQSVSILFFYISFVVALIAGALFAAKKPETRLESEVSAYFREGERVSWLWRIAVASTAYLPIYFAFWALIGPFVAQYCLFPPWQMITARFTLFVPLELLRGFLYVFALLPILATMRGRLGTIYFGVVSLLYVPGALAPLMIYPWTNPIFPLRVILPSDILPIHAVETLAESVVHGAVITLLLARKPK